MFSELKLRAYLWLWWRFVVSDKRDDASGVPQGLLSKLVIGRIGKVESRLTRHDDYLSVIELAVATKPKDQYLGAIGVYWVEAAYFEVGPKAFGWLADSKTLEPDQKKEITDAVYPSLRGSLPASNDE